MKRAFTVLTYFLVWSVFLLISPSPVIAQTPVTTAAESGNPCDAWFLAPVGCMKDALIKATLGALNKQAGDTGTASFSMGQFTIAAMGLCDATCDPSCPRSLSYQNSALAGLQDTALAMYTHPPAETRLYIADVGKTLGFMPKVQAQGIGFSGLSPLLGLWKAFRNVAYAFLTTIMVVIGFMVMFRKKIDPKTVVTVQNAIPRIVIALLLVTFSYAIVGILIDAMYLAIMLSAATIASVSPELGYAVALFSGGTTCISSNIQGSAGGVQFSVGTPATTTEITASLFNDGLWGMTKFFFGSGVQSLDDIARLLTGGFNQTGTALWIGVPGLMGGLLGKFKGAALGLVSAPLLLTAIIMIVLIFGFIRLVFVLVDAYINIIISLLTAPFHLMMEAVPGTNAFAGWFKNLISKIIVFPLTSILLMVSAILTSQTVSEKIWAPPLISAGNGGVGISGLIGLGMLLIIPSVIAGIQKSLKAEPMIPGGLGPIFGPISSGAGQLTQLWYQASFIKSGLRHKPDDRSGMQLAREGSQKGLGAITGGGSGGH